ncbi:dTMP kinase [Gordonibacter sp.]|uniref:dTMP kinase n=1 Tax=Gordonibacter sp. TaxID=1968902 RepID=UPI001F967921|nr:dTMP kinase [Gordonibacter sp.]HIW76934.1 dTMP kinase [Candidatus Gordonibacter avicola]
MNQKHCDTNTSEGVFITFEGGEGAGKTTHIRFLAEKLRARGREVVCLREPGGTDIGEKLRAIVLDPANKVMADETELLVYEAARAQIVAEVIRPALARGAVVLCDRFADSTIAYQVCGRGLPRAFVEQANAFACQGITPDRTILLVTGGSARKGLARATHRLGADRLEQAGEEFHTRVNEAFLELAEAHPERIRVVRSAEQKAKTAERVFRELADLFPWMNDVVDDPAFFQQLNRRRPSGHSNSGRKGQPSGKGAQKAHHTKGGAKGGGTPGKAAQGNGSQGTHGGARGNDAHGAPKNTRGSEGGRSCGRCL